MNSTVKPLCIELFAGLHGWGEGFAAEGFRVIGFDIVDMGKVCGVPRPAGCELVLQDVLTLHGSQFKDAACIVASPPCQKYSYLAMPWSRSGIATCKKCGGRGWSNVTYSACVTCNGVGKVDNSQAAKALRKKWEAEGPDNRLFDACFRIQREAIEATRYTCLSCHGTGVDWDELCTDCNQRGYHERYIPLIVENVRGAIPWVGKRMLADESEWFKLPESVRVRLGRSAWNYKSFHLWADVPALMPFDFKVPPKRAMDDLKNGVRAKHSEHLPVGDGIDGRKGDGVKVPSANGGRRTDVGKGARFTSRDCGIEADGVKQAAGGGDWFSKEAREGGSSARLGSKSNARRMASAMIAKIPIGLSRHIASVYHPKTAGNSLPIK